MAPDPTRPPGEEDPAKKRWQIIQMARVIGVLAVVLGILILRGVIEMGEETEWLGYLLVAIGLFEVFVVPTILARRWSTRNRVDLTGDDTTP